MLARYVKGLPRYPMDCGWWRHPKFAGMEPEALLLFQAAVSYSNEHATDGWMPTDPEDLALALGMKLRWIKAGLGALIKRGVLEVSGERTYIVGFADHNASSQEAAAHSDAKRAKAVEGNHIRWHLGEHGRPNPACHLCIAQRLATRSPEDSPGDSPPGSLDESPDDHTNDPKGREGKGRDRKTSPKPPSPTPPETTADRGGGEPSSNGTSDTTDQLLDATWSHMARTELQATLAAGHPIANTGGWLRTTRTTLAAEWTPDAHRWLETYPDSTAEQLAGLLLHGDGGAAAAALRIAETDVLMAELERPDSRQRARAPGPPPVTP